MPSYPIAGSGGAVFDSGTGQIFGPGGNVIGSATPGLQGSDLWQTVAAMNSLYGTGGAFAGTAGSGAGAAAGNAAAGGAAGGSNGEAVASISNTLRQYGLEDLIPLVDAWVRNGLSWSEIEAQLYDPKSSAGKIVDTRYPELRLRREAGKSPMTISQIRQYRDTATGMLRAAGLPSTFYDQPSDFTKWIVADVDVPELQERVGVAVDWAQQQPSEVRDQLQQLYGVDDGGIAAYAFDPQHALTALKRMGAASAVSGAASRTAFGGLTQAEAERLAALGVDFGAASQGFNALERSNEVFNPLTGQGGPTIGREQQLGAAFEGDAQAQAAIERAAGNRTGVFRGGGGVASNREGFAGLGASSR